MCDYDLPDEVIERDANGRPTVFCDPCIAPWVRALNQYGFRTLASCCGHDRTKPIITYETDEGDRHLVIEDATHVAVYDDLDEAMVAIQGDMRQQITVLLGDLVREFDAVETYWRDLANPEDRNINYGAQETRMFVISRLRHRALAKVIGEAEKGGES